jgi:hypothetical protein
MDNEFVLPPCNCNHGFSRSRYRQWVTQDDRCGGVRHPSTVAASVTHHRELVAGTVASRPRSAGLRDAEHQPMISVSDSELAAVMEAARPIPAHGRDQFLRDVASELARYPERRFDKLVSGVIEGSGITVMRILICQNRLATVSVQRLGCLPDRQVMFGKSASLRQI